jgi:Phosphoinositide phospholipase C, Ca2+-dependent
MSLFRPGIMPLLCAMLSLTAPAFADDAEVRINQIQVTGTHNSYHVGFAPSAAHLLQAKSPGSFASLDYGHPPLTRQLDDGVRQLELDVYADSKGGLYAHPAMTRLIAQAGLPPDPPIVADGVMGKPGFKVMHIQDVDQRSVCQPFTACLAEIRAWSRAHPGHVPLFILIENKQGALKNVDFQSVAPEPFTPAVFDELDREIASVFPRDEIITPDDVRGAHATLDEAVRDSGWPPLSQARGKVVFLMDQKPAGPIYLEGHPVLKGRLLFTNATAGAPDAAFIECNDCNAPDIDVLVRRGYLVRTRTDDPDQAQGRNNDTRRRDAVIDSGAQILSTDYPVHEPSAAGYAVGLPGNIPARCNPILKPEGCPKGTLDR